MRSGTGCNWLRILFSRELCINGTEYSGSNKSVRFPYPLNTTSVTWLVPKFLLKKLSFTVCRNINIITYCIYRMNFFSMALPALSGPWPFIQFGNHFSQTLGLLVRVISPSKGLYINTGQQKHRINVHTHQTSMLWVGFEPTISAVKRTKTAQALDLGATVTTECIIRPVNNIWELGFRGKTFITASIFTGGRRKGAGNHDRGFRSQSMVKLFEYISVQREKACLCFVFQSPINFGL
jgi:hypothetical protein